MGNTANAHFLSTICLTNRSSDEYFIRTMIMTATIFPETNQGRSELKEWGGALPRNSVGLGLHCVSGSQEPTKSHLRSGSDHCVALSGDADTQSPAFFSLWSDADDPPEAGRWGSPRQVTLETLRAPGAAGRNPQPGSASWLGLLVASTRQVPCHSPAEPGLHARAQLSLPAAHAEGSQPGTQMSSSAVGGGCKGQRLYENASVCVCFLFHPRSTPSASESSWHRPHFVKEVAEKQR